MPANITPAVNPTFPTLFTVPSDGDPNAALSVITPFQSALDGIAVAQAGLYGAVGRKSYRCLDNTNITIDALGPVVLTEAGLWYALSHTAPTTVSAAVLTGGIVADTRYYIYARRVAGVVGFVAGTTAPEATLKYENGNTDRAYVGTFVTDGTPLVKAFIADNGLYKYCGGATGTVISPTFFSGFTGMPGGWADVSLEQAGKLTVPSFATSALVRVGYAAAGAQNIYFSFDGNVDNNSYSFEASFDGGVATLNSLFGEVAIRTNTLSFRGSNAGTSVDWTAVGFRTSN